MDAAYHSLPHGMMQPEDGGHPQVQYGASALEHIPAADHRQRVRTFEFPVNSLVQDSTHPTLSSSPHKKDVLCYDESFYPLTAHAHVASGAYWSRSVGRCGGKSNYCTCSDQWESRGYQFAIRRITAHSRCWVPLRAHMVHVPVLDTHKWRVLTAYVHLTA